MYEKFCDRCNCEMRAYRISWFNGDVICHICQELEEQHPLFTYAKKVKNEEMLKRNRKFKGIYAHLKWDEIQKRKPMQTEYALLVSEVASLMAKENDSYEDALAATVEAFLYEEHRYTLEEILYANKRTSSELEKDVMVQVTTFSKWNALNVMESDLTVLA
ncbi:hypothetical protein [Niallia taxi]|uniref:hypothetical protein n=1 Tax=Niallia taxi TaxID=2499688 RepID=UPI0015F7683B|nr:hypothetical protein [Niallia taxi]